MSRKLTSFIKHLLYYICYAKYYKEIMLATHYTPRNSYILYTFHEKTVVTLKSWINIFKKIRALSSFAAKKAV